MATKQQQQLINGELYHIIVRSVGDTEVFKDINDYYRGIYSIYEFNNTKHIEIRERRRERKIEKSCGDKISATRDLLVEVLAFCFMPNHIHLLLKHLKDNGVSEFIRKIGIGYAGYFNERYSWKGHLFNRFKSVHIEDDDQLKIVFNYIHTNPLSLIEPGWKEVGIKEPKRAVKFLEEEYRWSSFFDFIGKKNFPSVTEREFLLDVMDGEQGCKDSVEDWIKYNENIKKFPELFLE